MNCPYNTNMKTAVEIFGDETRVIRHDMEGLCGKLSLLSGDLKKFSADQQKIVGNLREIRRSQESFQDRVDAISEKLRNCKTVLASYSS
ncbi:MAG: hypothetical protein Q7T11_07335 [Deltaproteobacteria bacterium]|nr:hypothetical protein [Deltaproteobacteria bacterium]